MITYPAERKLILKQVPWVQWLDDGVRCDALRSGAPLKAYYGHNGEPPNPDPYRCKKVAHWHFTALSSSYSVTGIYCLSHLTWRGLYGDMEEEARTEKWYAEYTEANKKEAEPF